MPIRPNAMSNAYAGGGRRARILCTLRTPHQFTGIDFHLVRISTNSMEIILYGRWRWRWRWRAYFLGQHLFSDAICVCAVANCCPACVSGQCARAHMQIAKFTISLWWRKKSTNYHDFYALNVRLRLGAIAALDANITDNRFDSPNAEKYPHRNQKSFGTVQTPMGAITEHCGNDEINNEWLLCYLSYADEWGCDAGMVKLMMVRCLLPSK